MHRLRRPTLHAGLAFDLAAAGVTIVSGLARGIDGWAHRGALEAGGRTVAVLGCGIDRDYHAPTPNSPTRSPRPAASSPEYEPGIAPAPWRFPARNRIVAALSDVVVIVEARERSGALITVDLAIEIAARSTPSPVETTSALSSGTNQLIRLGYATLITCAADVLEDIATKELH